MNRIFPNNLTDKIDSSKAFTGINWDKVQEQVQTIRKAGNDDGLSESQLEHVDNFINMNPGVSDDVIDGFATYIANNESEFTKLSAEEKDKVMVKMAGKTEEVVTAGKKGKIPEQFKPFIKKKGGEKNKDGEEEVEAVSKTKKSAPREKKEEFFKNMKDKKKTTKAGILPEIQTKRVIAFTHKSQLSAEAVQAAIAAGDEELKNTILAARHAKRVAMAERLQNALAVPVESKENTKVAKKESNERKVVAEQMVEEHENVLAESNNTLGFKAATDLNELEQDAFTKIAASYGFPKEYVDYMLTGGTDPSNEAKQIVELIQTENISKEAKATAVKSMVRESNLSDKDLSYLKNYWINILGYDAKDWVDDLFTNKFYRKSS